MPPFCGAPPLQTRGPMFVLLLLEGFDARGEAAAEREQDLLTLLALAWALAGPSTALLLLERHRSFARTS